MKHYIRIISVLLILSTLLTFVYADNSDYNSGSDYTSGYWESFLASRAKVNANLTEFSGGLLPLGVVNTIIWFCDEDVCPSTDSPDGYHHFDSIDEYVWSSSDDEYCAIGTCKYCHTKGRITSDSLKHAYDKYAANKEDSVDAPEGSYILYQTSEYIYESLDHTIIAKRFDLDNYHDNEYYSEPFEVRKNTTNSGDIYYYFSCEEPGHSVYLTIFCGDGVHAIQCFTSTEFFDLYSSEWYSKDELFHNHRTVGTFSPFYWSKSLGYTTLNNEYYDYYYPVSTYPVTPNGSYIVESSIPQPVYFSSTSDFPEDDFSNTTENNVITTNNNTNNFEFTHYSFNYTDRSFTYYNNQQVVYYVEYGDEYLTETYVDASTNNEVTINYNYNVDDSGNIYYTPITNNNTGGAGGSSYDDTNLLALIRQFMQGTFSRLDNLVQIVKNLRIKNTSVNNTIVYAPIEPMLSINPDIDLNTYLDLFPDAHIKLFPIEFNNNGTVNLSATLELALSDLIDFEVTDVSYDSDGNPIRIYGKNYYYDVTHTNNYYYLDSGNGNPILLFIPSDPAYDDSGLLSWLEAFKVWLGEKLDDLGFDITNNYTDADTHGTKTLFQWLLELIKTLIEGIVQGLADGISYVISHVIYAITDTFLQSIKFLHGIVDLDDAGDALKDFFSFFGSGDDTSGSGFDWASEFAGVDDF